jgi:hypothetical protein
MFALYRKGDTHKVDGFPCEVVRVVLGDLDLYRKDGWVDNIEDLYPEAKEKIAAREVEEKKRIEEIAVAKKKTQDEEKKFSK